VGEKSFNPQAVFDCLYIGRSLTTSLGTIAEAELHLFAYLSCLLFLYKGHPASDWGYEFTSTHTGAPYSLALQASVQGLIGASLLRASGEFLVLEPAGIEECNQLSALSLNSERIAFLEAACSSQLMLPVGIIRMAISEEPTLRPTVKYATSRRLLDGPATVRLYEQFDALNQAVGSETPDLLVPASVWLTYLSHIAKKSLTT